MGAKSLTPARDPSVKRPIPDNFRARPAKPALGNGRIQRAVRRAFMASDSPVLSSSDIYRWVYPNKYPGWLECWSVFVVLRQCCHRVGRADTRGRPWLWRLRDDGEKR